MMNLLFWKEPRTYIMWDAGFCVLVCNRPWPTRKPHYVYCYWD